MSFFKTSLKAKLLEAEIPPVDDDAVDPEIAPAAPGTAPAAPKVAAPLPKTDLTPVKAVPGTVDNRRKLALMNEIIDNMLDESKKKVMLAGDTGIGKTSFVKDFCKMLGMPMVLIEVPHTVEEHLINIPFIVIDANGGKSQGVESIDVAPEPGNDTEQPTSYDIELARSNLVTTLERHNKISDAQYASHIAKLPANVKALLDEFNQQNPRQIQRARAKAERILFLDEYFRQTTRSIRNSLRNLLDYRIGNDTLPSGTYIMYASNTADKGLDLEQSQHATFLWQDFDSPTVSAWLNNLIGGKASASIDFKKDVIDAFVKSLKDEHMSKERVEGQVRISPRRWTEILLQINAAYPFDDPKETSILLTTLKRQFQNDAEHGGGQTEVYSVLSDIVTDLINKSGMNPSKLRNIKTGEWRDVVAHHVLQKAKMGENKKYIPVVQGPPGIGKTSLGATFEDPPYNMRFIMINTTDLDADSVVGVPVSKVVNGERTTQFSKPSLYIKIQQLMEANRKEYIRDLKEQEAAGELEGKTAAEAYREWESQQYKYVIFFDEINRVKDLTVFNSLRRLILEKEFNHEFKLPEEVVVVGAMNPDDKGTVGMTDHFKDSIDLIDADPDWADTLEYIQKRGESYKSSEKYSALAVDTAVQIIDAFPKVFTHRNKKHKNHQFYINVGEVDEIYINPRDYDEMFKALCYGINRELEKLTDRLDAGQTVTDDEVNAAIVKVGMEKFRGSLKWMIFKSGFDVPSEFWARLQQMLRETINVSLKKTVTAAGLPSMLDAAITSTMPLSDDHDFAEYMAEYMPGTFYNDFYGFVGSKTDKFMNHEGTDINIESAIPFLVKQDKGSLYDICKELINAVKVNKYETGIFDQIDDVVFQYLSVANKAIAANTDNDDTLEKAVLSLLTNYDDIRALMKGKAI